MVKLAVATHGGIENIILHYEKNIYEVLRKMIGPIEIVQKSATCLSTKIRNLNRSNTNFELEWRILQTSHPYKPNGDECRLCLAEIYWIFYHPAEATLNHRREFISKCRHRNKFLLSNI